MNNYLISIRKPFTDLIFHTDPFELIKTNEWRKKPLPIGHYFVYESKHKRGCGKVVGEFDIVENHEFPIGSISFEDCQAHDLVHQGIVPYGFLKHYADGAGTIYANIIKNAEHYQEPRELSEFKKPCDHFNDCCTCKRAMYEHREGTTIDRFAGCDDKVTRPPQSWCRIAEKKAVRDGFYLKIDLKKYFHDRASYERFLQLQMGCPVWFVYDFGSVEGECFGMSEGVVRSITFDETTVWLYCVYNDGLTYHHTTDEIGDRLFFSQKQAEQKLKELNGKV